ncbi:hypothetical protein O181_104494, partial [Austropuccinia psidii MF-1]|nr:hypothetical protein [Austropuccinia psidii MF-1]
EENFIPLETQSQGSTPVIPGEPQSRKGKGKRHSESLITARKWTPIATQRSGKLQNSASIQGKQTLTTSKGKITIIHPVLTSKGKFPKELRNVVIPRNQLEDREGFSRTRRPGRGHLENGGGWKETEGNNTHSTIHLPIQQKPQTRGLEGYGSSSSAPPTPQRSIPMEPGQQEVQPSITLGGTWSNFKEDMSQGDILQRLHGNYKRMESHQAVQTPGERETRIRENQATVKAIENS